MKKKLAVLLALVMLCATVLTACGGSSLEGTTWSLSSVSSDQAELTGDELTELMGGEFTFSFKKDDVVTVKASGIEGNGEWSQDGDKIKISADGSEFELIKDGDKLTMEEQGSKMIFTKN